MHGARQEQPVHPHRARRGNRAGRGPALAPGQRAAPRVSGRNLRPPAAHIVPTARSESRKQKNISFLTITELVFVVYECSTNPDRILQGAALRPA